jgi:pyridoxine 4-oxidase
MPIVRRSTWAAELLPGPTGEGEAGKIAFLQKSAFTHHHPVGTCRMGIDARAVVTPDLKVVDTDGLYVCDASVLPAITTGPVNAAVVAIAERAADLLRGLAPLPRAHPPNGTTSR